ncbi:MAG: hypothetical protein ACI3V5_06220 [Faecousia sp.]
MKKRIWLILALILASCFLGGCALQTVEEMYALPKRSQEYSSLQSAIDSAMYGLTYSAPVSGENQQTVQMADLDGDGADEYIVFAQGSSANPLQVLIFRQEEDGSCRLMEVIESNGSAFEQVEYVQMDDAPGYELVVGRQLSDQVLRSVTVYSFSGGSAEQLMMVGYSKFLTCDLDEDGYSELMVILPGESETGTGAAVLYRIQDGIIERSVEADMSEEPSHIKRITVGRLYSGEPAVFVASAVNEQAIITDVFAWRDGRFTNISFSRESDTSVQTLRNYYVYADDIDGDGVLELPSLVTMKRVSMEKENHQKFLIRWFAMDIEGREVDKLYTFHNYLGGWYLQLDEEWAARISVEQEGGEYIFYVWDDSYQEASALFSIYALTGGSREEDATVDGRFAFYRAEGVVYAARLENNAAEYGITENQLINSFHLIRQDWKTGET